MRRLITFRRLVLTAVMVVGLSVCVNASSAWESMPTPAGIEQADIDKVDVNVRDGYIYVYTPTRTSVKVFSILGQLISQETLPSGMSRLKISAKGIYILKIGSITRRVTI